MAKRSSQERKEPTKQPCTVQSTIYKFLQAHDDTQGPSCQQKPCVTDISIAVPHIQSDSPDIVELSSEKHTLSLICKSDRKQISNSIVPRIGFNYIHCFHGCNHGG